MVNRWNDTDAQGYVSGHDCQTNRDLLLQAYATTLFGAESDLTMHGGGNTSVKMNAVDNLGNTKRALYVKASGTPLNTFTPDCFVAMDLDFLEGLRSLSGLSHEAMALEFKKHLLADSDKIPSIESLMHAFVPAKFVSHTHPAAILKIVNRIGGRELLKECFGDDMAVIPYTKMGYDLAKAVSEAIRGSFPNCVSVVMQHHGLITWGEEAFEAYNKMIDIVTKAEIFLKKIFVSPIAPPKQKISADKSIQNYELIIPIIKKCYELTLREIDADNFPTNEISFTLLNTPAILDLINSPDGQNIVTTPPMTPDYPMLMRILPLWVDVDIDNHHETLFTSIKNSIARHITNYQQTLKSHGATATSPTDLLPAAVIHPQIGAICFGQTAKSAYQIADFTRQALDIRRAIAESGGTYESLPTEYLFEAQYRNYQQSTIK